MLSPASTNLVDKGFKLIPVGHPVSFPWQICKLAASFLEGIGFVSLILLPSLDNFSSVFDADFKLALHVDTVPENAVDHAIES
jgi:hypothetical protein